MPSSSLCHETIRHPSGAPATIGPELVVRVVGTVIAAYVDGVVSLAKIASNNLQLVVGHDEELDVLVASRKHRTMEVLVVTLPRPIFIECYPFLFFSSYCRFATSIRHIDMERAQRTKFFRLLIISCTEQKCSRCQTIVVENGCL